MASPERKGPRFEKEADPVETFVELEGPEVGEAAPNFTLESHLGGTVSLAEFRGKSHVVLFFYPKDDTPECTKEACSFGSSLKAFERRGAVVLGVSRDSVKSHAKFAAKFDLTFALLSDPEGEVSREYGVLKRKSLYGRAYLGIDRSTFLIDKKGKVAAAWRGVKVEGHADEVLAAIGKLT